NLMGAEIPPTLPALLAYRARGTETVSAETLQQEAAARRPELRIAEQEVASARAQQRITRGERLPSVSVVGRYAERAGADSEYFNDWNVGVQLSVPILDGGVRHAREEAEARVQVTEHSVAESAEALTIERLKYKQGVGVITDLLNAESAALT